MGNKTSLIAMKSYVLFTHPETNIAPETLGLEDEFPFGKASCQVLCLFLGVQPSPSNGCPVAADRIFCKQALTHGFSLGF